MSDFPTLSQMFNSSLSPNQYDKEKEDENDKPSLTQMMDEQFKPKAEDDQLTQAASAQSSSPSVLDKLKAFFVANQDANSQTLKDSTAINGDRIKMALNPSLQGPSSNDVTLPAEEKLSNNSLGLATMGIAAPRVANNLDKGMQSASEAAKDIYAGLGREAPIAGEAASTAANNLSKGIQTPIEAQAAAKLFAEKTAKNAEMRQIAQEMLAKNRAMAAERQALANKAAHWAKTKAGLK